MPFFDLHKKTLKIKFLETPCPLCVFSGYCTQFWTESKNIYGMHRSRGDSKFPLNVSTVWGWIEWVTVWVSCDGLVTYSLPSPSVCVLKIDKPQWHHWEQSGYDNRRMEKKNSSKGVLVSESSMAHCFLAERYRHIVPDIRMAANWNSRELLRTLISM